VEQPLRTSAADATMAPAPMVAFRDRERMMLMSLLVLLQDSGVGGADAWDRH
jgi:hypothetical protein